MSSSYVRTEILNFLSANSSEKVIDLSGEFEEIQEMIATAGLAATDPWIGIQFIGNEEVPVTVGATNNSGMYRESGAIYFHVVSIAKLGGTGTILTRGESLRNLFRGQRIGGLVIDSITPVNFDSGATLRFSGGYMSGSFLVSYYRDYNL